MITVMILDIGYNDFIYFTVSTENYALSVNVT